MVSLPYAERSPRPQPQTVAGGGMGGGVCGYALMQDITLCISDLSPSRLRVDFGAHLAVTPPHGRRIRPDRYPDEAPDASTRGAT
jgi:hypothetical protein